MSEMQYNSAAPSIVIIDDVEYLVRHNYLHRGLNPRLVLEHRVKGQNVIVQADRTYDLIRSIQFDDKYFQSSFNGYWVEKGGYHRIVFKLKNIKYLG